MLVPKEHNGGVVASILYLYFDEGGDFNFSPTGSAFFAMTCVAMSRPFTVNRTLLELKYDCLERGLSIGRFHAAEDKQAVRDRVFAAICARLGDYRVRGTVQGQTFADKFAVEEYRPSTFEVKLSTNKPYVF